MSRSLVILVAVVVALMAGILLLSMMDTEVAPTRVEKPVTNDAAAQ